MALPASFPVQIDTQSVLAAGTTVLYTCPARTSASISTIRLTNAGINTVTLTINRVNPASSVNAYTFTLAAGDVLVDSAIYNFLAGDSISVTTSAASTNCFVRGVQTANATVY